MDRVQPQPHDDSPRVTDSTPSHDVWAPAPRKRPRRCQLGATLDPQSTTVPPWRRPTGISPDPRQRRGGISEPGLTALARRGAPCELRPDARLWPRQRIDLAGVPTRRRLGAAPHEGQIRSRCRADRRKAMRGSYWRLPYVRAGTGTRRRRGRAAELTAMRRNLTA